ncbi:MAG TPA: ArgE/DapE family deacylase [Gemmatimonadaceae bacterium]|nr:ArgE/DapE family deacylase [Gemmatimonadaceae bacterium]
MSTPLPCPPGDAVALARDLVRVDSRNPSLAPGGPGEEGAARLLRAVLDAWGFRTTMLEAAPGRPNVIARIGDGRGPTLMLNGHLDVVGTDGMTHPPFEATVRDGRLYGRGACDMKAGVAAMCAAAWRAHQAGLLRGEVIVAAVVDEEWESLGTRALLAHGVRADAAVVTEPTRLTVAPAHRGFAWVEVTVHGRAAHGSRYDEGVDAIMLAAQLLAELERYEREELTRRTHPLLGRASLHASTIAGGTGLSTYPERCTLTVERRTLPGERGEDALREVREACERVRARRPEFRADVVALTAQAPSDVPVDAPLVRALGAALAAEGEAPRVEGLSCWTDAALLNAGGIPAVCFGPGDIALAHADEEWVPIDEIERATRVLTRLLATWTSDQ